MIKAGKSKLVAISALDTIIRKGYPIVIIIQGVPQIVIRLYSFTFFRLKYII